MQKYGLSRDDFVKYREYFLKTLEKSWFQSEEQEKSVKLKHDKSFKEILSDKTEMAVFLEQFIKIKIKPEELEEQKNNYINKQFERREADIIYRIKNKEIYILLEHQSKVDKRMPRRIFEYCMGIMMELETSKKDDDGSNPIIIPIVIYTGTKKWNVKTNFSDTQKTEDEYQEYKINLNYKLIDINKYSKTELLEKDTKLASMMILEKCKTRDELKNHIIEIVLKSQFKERIEWVKKIVNYVFADTLGDDANKILNVLEKGEIDDMEDLIERIEINEAKIRRDLIKKGRLEGIIENMMKTIKNMLQQNEDEEKIMKYTNAKIEDIEKAKRELGMI